VHVECFHKQHCEEEMNTVLLFRKTLAEEDEMSIAQKHCRVVEQRSEISNDLVIGRYSVLPYYRELEKDIKNVGGRLINSYQQYSYVSKINWWYEDMKDITPATWFDIPSVPEHAGPFVLKGSINSRKQLWKTHMYAENKKQAIEVHNRLLDDTLIGHQDIVVRQHIPLVNYGNDIVGMPISREFRIFVLFGKIVSTGFYWSIHSEDISPSASKTDDIDFSLVHEVINRVGDKCNFYTVDIAQKTDGDWVLIEMGDAQMAGLSCNDPETLYKKIADEFHNRWLKITGCV